MNKRILLFEGAGWEKAEHNGVGNCRIRTRIKNKDGRIIYLEIHGIQNNKYNKLPFEFTGFISHCFYEDREEDSYNNYSPELSQIEQKHFKYSKNGILKFVNENLNCSFNELQVINDGSLKVHNTKEALCSSL